MQDVRPAKAGDLTQVWDHYAERTEDSAKISDHGKFGYIVGASKRTDTFLDGEGNTCLLYTSPSPRDRQKSRMPSSA